MSSIRYNSLVFHHMRQRTSHHLAAVSTRNSKATRAMCCASEDRSFLSAAATSRCGKARMCRTTASCGPRTDTARSRRSPPAPAFTVPSASRPEPSWPPSLGARIQETERNQWAPDGDAWSQIVPSLDHRMQHRLVNRDPIRYGNVSKPGKGTYPVRQITAAAPPGTRATFLHFIGRFFHLPVGINWMGATPPGGVAQM